MCLRVGHTPQILVYGSLIPCTVIAVIKDKALIQYTRTGAGQQGTFLAFVSANRNPADPIEDWERNPYGKRLPKKWVRAMTESGK